MQMNLGPPPSVTAPQTPFTNASCQAKPIPLKGSGKPGEHQAEQFSAPRQGRFARFAGRSGAAARVLGGLLVLLTLVAPALTAQEYRGRIQGVIRDTSDAVIVSATVTLRNNNTGITVVRGTAPAGRYIFDLVEPGSYSVSVESPGFTRFVQANVPLGARGDVTVDATLKTGSVTETVTVTAEATQIQFTTSSLDTTVEAKLSEDLPQLYRNPFLLATLDPSVLKDDTSSEYQPFNSWGPGRLSIGGGANFSNDLQVDGSRVGVSVKTGYVPAPDMVQEITISQNTVDAEFGRGSGSAISIVTKGGTNQLHASAFYNGRYPWANAVSDRYFRTVSLDRQHMFGGTVGHRILKNRLFNFVSYEGWKYTNAASPYTATLPTDLERQGNFSQTPNKAGATLMIYDPWTTMTGATGTGITRTPFPGNIIPKARQDPIAVKLMGALWKPNAPGQGWDHLNNYISSLPINYPYKNFADRVDFHVNDRLNISARVQIFRTPASVGNPTGSPLFDSDRGSQRDGNTYSGTVTYTLDSKTIVTASMDYHNFTDASHFAPQVQDYTFAGLYPSSKFYAPLYTDPAFPKLQVRMSITGDGGRWLTMGPSGGYWNQTPHGDGLNLKVSRQQRRHYLKAGFETLGTNAPSVIQNCNPGFGFNPDITNATYVSPSAITSGNPYASFLLGAVVPIGASPSAWDSTETSMSSLMKPTVTTRFFGVFLNDDIKISRNLTLNLGLRYEYDQPYTEEQNRITFAMDLTKPIPELQNVQMPAGTRQFYTGPWTLNGAFQFTSKEHPGAWNADKGVLSPRIGVAYRLSSKMAVRAGYGRYGLPHNMNSSAVDQFSAPYTGFANYTDAPPHVQGVPQMQLSDPFTSAWPVVPSYGKSYGAYTAIGDNITFINPDRPRSFSNRLNVTLQRELPAHIRADATYFLNRSSRINNINYNINQVDPRIALQYGSATNVQVANPFYHLTVPNKSPGALWNQASVGATTLAKPYPHYGTITVIDGMTGGDMVYHSLQLKAAKSFSGGYTLLVGYNYNVQTNHNFYDNVDNYLKNFTSRDSGRYRHRLTASGTWQLPVGKGRKFLRGSSRLADAVVGGWNLATTTVWHTGTLLNFGAYQVKGDPKIADPGPAAWFDTTVFAYLPAYTRRSNPWYYSNIRGPQFLNFDATMAKEFSITEKLKLQLRLESFNVINNANVNNPNMSLSSSLFGKSNDIYSQAYGRRLQMGLRLRY